MPRRKTPSHHSFARLAVLLPVVAWVACAQAPPVPEAPLVALGPPPPPEPTCEVSPEPECRPFGDCAPAEVVGRVCTRTVRDGESLIEMARQYDLGFNVVESANPDLDPFVPAPGSTVVIPTSWIVPRAARPGTLVVNLSEMRLFLFPREAAAPLTFPVGVGSEGWKTPEGSFSVVKKQQNPTWFPTASIRRENPELPAAVPPGPDNPLGTHSLRLSRGTILIHGTDTPFAVGRKASHGCLRLYPEDIPHLYDQVPVGTKVLIVREPVKVGVRDDRIHVEVHDDPDAGIDAAAEARKLLTRRGLLDRVDRAKLDAALRARRGYPVDVTRSSGS